MTGDPVADIRLMLRILAAFAGIFFAGVAWVTAGQLWRHWRTGNWGD